VRVPCVDGLNFLAAMDTVSGNIAKAISINDSEILVPKVSISSNNYCA